MKLNINIPHEEVLRRIKKSYSHYYSFTTNVLEPFTEQAEFHSNNSRYFLLKKAKLAEEEVNEYVYFVSLDNLNLEKLNEIIETAWNDGLSKVQPHSNHRCSDITVVIITDSVSKETKEYIKRIKLSKRYKFTFHGWSYFRLVVFDLNKNELIFNNKGKDLRKLFQNINLKR